MRQTFDESTDPAFGARHLPLLRARMAEQGLDGFLVPHEDEHQNEYLPQANERLAWISGFTGSAGAAASSDAAAAAGEGTGGLGGAGGRGARVMRGGSTGSGGATGAAGSSSGSVPARR